MLHERLRRGTAAWHARVDAAYGGFDLGERTGYLDFLSTQARALVTAEAALTSKALPAWSGRAHLLAQDLRAMGRPLPSPAPLGEAPGPAEQVGLLYVLEGSRLGAQMLARRVPDGWPKAFLAASHAPGAWRGFKAWLDAAGARGGEDWMSRALAGAVAGFELFERAASPVPLESGR